MKIFPTRLMPARGRVGRFKPRRYAPSSWQPFVIRQGEWEFLGVTRRGMGSVILTCQPYRFGSCPLLTGLPQWVVDMQKRKVPDSGTPGKLPQAALGTKVLLKFQNLVQHLAVTQYDDGSPRTAGTLILFTNGVVWRAVLKDPDTSSKLVVSQETLDDLLNAAEMLLGSPDTMWEQDQYAVTVSKGRGKKK